MNSEVTKLSLLIHKDAHHKHVILEEVEHYLLADILKLTHSARKTCNEILCEESEELPIESNLSKTELFSKILDEISSVKQSCEQILSKSTILFCQIVNFCNYV